MTDLTPTSCDLFNRPCFQFAQLKKYAPESIPQLKADYKAAWENWRAIIQRVAILLGEPFAAPHIERWCNGWQVRAHFFAYFKYHDWQDSAAILSVLLNRRRLTVSLDWHCYKAGISTTTIDHYNRWPDALDRTAYADYDLWHGSDDEWGRAGVGAANKSRSDKHRWRRNPPAAGFALQKRSLSCPKRQNPNPKRKSPCTTPSSPSPRSMAATPTASPRCVPSSPNTA